MVKEQLLRSRSGKYACQFIPAKPSATAETDRLVNSPIKIILKVVDDTGDNFEQIEINLRETLKKIVRMRINGESSDKIISTNVYDEPFFPRQKGAKRIVISVEPPYETYEFRLVRVNTFEDKTLKNLALKAVTDKLTTKLPKNVRLINKMDIPETLKVSLIQDSLNGIITRAMKQFPKKTYWLPYAESLKSKENLVEQASDMNFYYYCCPIKDCTFLIDKAGLTGGEAAKHITRIHKVTTSVMEKAPKGFYKFKKVKAETGA